MATLPFFLGRCKQCKATVRVEPTVEKKRVLAPYSGFASPFGPRYEDVYTYTLPNGERSRGSFARFFSPCVCGRHVEFRRVFGTKGVKECNGACMSAKGPSCDCKCEGKNHGAGFAIAMGAHAH